ncbi:MAG: hypothetical protein GEU77_09885 [Deltaproteobacteria bacterium]|nr:hypothetical protein [Deltaproteobacteria bacterium]
MMMRLERVLVPTDFSEHSRRALRYALSLAMETRATITVLHVANDFDAWELYSDEFSFMTQIARAWPTDRVLAEASLELSNFLEPHMEACKRIPSVTKRVVLGPIAHEIARAADELQADLIVISPHRQRGFRRIFGGGITDRVTRMSPCPVLSVTDPLPSRPWRGKFKPNLFGWPRQRPAQNYVVSIHS